VIGQLGDRAHGSAAPGHGPASRSPPRGALPTPRVCAALALRPRTDPIHDVRRVPLLQGIVGQDSAVEALRFGIECAAPDRNVFVRGRTGTGRMRLVRRLLDELMPACRLESDQCYVHDFNAPDRPRLLVLPPGQGRAPRKRVHELAKFVREHLGELLTGEAVDERFSDVSCQVQKIQTATARSGVRVIEDTAREHLERLMGDIRPGSPSSACRSSDLDDGTG